MSTAKEAYRMLENQTLWETVVESHAILQAASAPHAILDGVAVCLHGYQRNTVDLDLLICQADQQLIRTSLENAGFTWSAEHAEFRSPSGVSVQLLLAGDRAGKDSEVLLPNPAVPETKTEIEGLPVLTLARLIEVELACGLGSARRMHRDLADVVELIAIHNLGREFARHIHKSVRPAFRKLVGQVRQ
jgi:hypothetical protein